MYLFTNACKNLIRNKSRNLLFGSIIFAIILTTSAAMIINMTSNQAIRYYKSKFGAEVSITNMSSNQDKEKQKPLDGETLLSFSNSEYIQSKQYDAQIAIIPKGLQVLQDNGNELKDVLSAKAYVKGSNHPDVSDEFTKGMKKIVEGSMYRNPKEALISTSFAKLNGLNLHDTITVISNIKDKEMPMQLTITGIYEDKSLSQDSQNNGPLFHSGNDIYTSFETVANSKIFQTYGTLDVKMSLKDPELLEKFKAELQTKGLPEYYSVTVDEETYRMMVAPIENIAGVSNKVMMSVMVCGSLILLLLSLMSIRERKYEIGVLRAMGLKKGAVALGFLIESTIIVGICLILGLGMIQGFQKQIATSLISTQVTEGKEQQQIISNVKFRSKEMIQISLASVGLIFISSISGVFFATRYEPSKILSERN